jgi:hypothetical protein
MDPVHLHLVLNHVPLFGSAVGSLLLVVAMLRKSGELKRVAFAMLVVTALLTLPVYLTGEPAEEVVEHLAGVAKPAIEVHEEAAKIAFVAMLATGAIALTSLVLFRSGRIIPNWFTATVFAMCIVTYLLMARTANLGGKVRHTELDGAAAVSTAEREDD